MGAQLAGENPEKVAGVAGIYPAFDLSHLSGIDKAAPAYELTAAELQQQLKQFNPIEQAGKLARAKVPAMFIHGLQDEVVPFKPNVGEFASRYQDAGAQDLVTVLGIEGQGHNFWKGFFRSEKLIDFAIARAKAGVPQRQAKRRKNAAPNKPVNVAEAGLEPARGLPPTGF